MSAPATDQDSHHALAVTQGTRPMPLWEVPRTSQAWTVGKRALDIALAALAVLTALPIMLVVALLIKLDSPGPVLFRQRRYGRHQQLFTVLKFRTMATGASAESHRRYIAELASGGHGAGLQKLTHVPRLTRLGAFLRKSSLDELPQLFNVLAGQMSLVGPRPAIDYELEHYEPRHFSRFAVKPGLTGLWQVSGRSKVGFMEMLALDEQYARSSSPLTDIKILLRTPVEIFRGRCA